MSRTYGLCRGGCGYRVVPKAYLLRDKGRRLGRSGLCDRCRAAQDPPPERGPLSIEEARVDQIIARRCDDSDATTIRQALGLAV